MELGVIIGIIFAFIFVASIFNYFVPVGLWVKALFSGVKVGLFSLIGMRIRKVPPSSIIDPLISATKAGLSLDINGLEAHYLACGNSPVTRKGRMLKRDERVGNLVTALVSAAKAGIELNLERATAIDLAGRDILDAVHTSVNPRVIETPRVTAVARNGIQLTAIARVTIRANIERLVGGAGTDTILARVGEGIVTTIGSAETHKAVLENPDEISKMVLKKGLDAGTAFEILSIDIADVDVGSNVGAKLQIDQANADKQIAQAKAEERKAMAIAQEQEMTAKVQEMRALVVEAEAEVPRAMSEAFRAGNLGIMDYYKMKNVKADTDMRKAISEGTKDTTE